jgi:hypothetical protein
LEHRNASENGLLILKEDQILSTYLPETEWLTTQTLKDMLHQYTSVVLKPADYVEGTGFILVHSLGTNRYVVESGLDKKRIDGKESLYPHLVKEICQNHNVKEDKVKDILCKSYLVQRWIPLAKLDERPFGIRVVVQKEENGLWEVTAKLAKLTNSVDHNPTHFTSGLTLISIDKAIRNCSLYSQLDKVALQAAVMIGRHFPACQMIGFDMGVDTQGKLWIIRVNFESVNALFLRLEDKSSMIDKIPS